MASDRGYAQAVKLFDDALGLYRGAPDIGSLEQGILGKYGKVRQKRVNTGAEAAGFMKSGSMPTSMTVGGDTFLRRTLTNAFNAPGNKGSYVPEEFRKPYVDPVTGRSISLNDRAYARNMSNADMMGAFRGMDDTQADSFRNNYVKFLENQYKKQAEGPGFFGNLLRMAPSLALGAIGGPVFSLASKALGLPNTIKSFSNFASKTAASPPSSSVAINKPQTLSNFASKNKTARLMGTGYGPTTHGYGPSRKLK